jgi:hypothetical protein
MTVGDGLRFIFDRLSLDHLAISHLDFTKIDSLSLSHALRSSDSAFSARIPVSPFLTLNTHARPIRSTKPLY